MPPTKLSEADGDPPVSPTRSAGAARKARLVVCGGAVGLLLGAAVGYLTGEPTYRSSGTIDFHAPFEVTETNRDSFDQYVRKQIETLRSPAVTGRAESKTAGTFTATRIETAPARVAVSLTDHDAKKSVTGLAAIVEAFKQSCEAARAAAAQQVLAELDHRKSLENDLAKNQAQAAQIAASVAPLSLDQVHATKLADLSKITGYLSETRLALATLTSLPTPAAGTVSPDERLRHLAKADPRLQEILDRRDQLRDQIAALSLKVGGNAPELVTLRADAEAVDRRIEQYGKETPSVPVTVETFGSKVALNADELRDREQKLVVLEQQAKAAGVALGDKLAERKKLENEATAIRAKMDESTARAAKITTDAEVGGTLEISLPHDPPTVTTADPRPVSGLIGCGIGAVLGALLTMVLVRTDVRMRRPQSADLGPSNSPLLGTVPHIGPEGSTTEEADVTALSIHQIRAMIEIRAKGGGAHAFAISSPSAGSGKTSLTVGLASSLAISGTRTLLVDCELASRVMDATNPDGAESDPAKPKRQSLGDVFVDMGYLGADETDIFLGAPDASVGLIAMLEGAPLRHSVIRTSMQGLAVLPVLSAQANHVGKLSCKFIRQLIEDAKADYDVILFDTGPIPGSVEALLVASEVDGVILVAAEGEMQSRFDHSVRYLGMIGAKLLGTVFNRAARKDLAISAAKDRPEKSQTGEGDGKRLRSSIGPQQHGSGLLAAAVHAQANPDLRERPLSASDAGDIDGDVTPDKKPERATPQIVIPSEISFRDAGSVTEILNDDLARGPIATDSQLEEAISQMVMDARAPKPRPVADKTPPATNH